MFSDNFLIFVNMQSIKSQMKWKELASRLHTVKNRSKFISSILDNLTNTNNESIGHNIMDKYHLKMCLTCL